MTKISQKSLYLVAALAQAFSSNTGFNAMICSPCCSLFSSLLEKRMLRQVKKCGIQLGFSKTRILLKKKQIS